tara:strand:- start:3501 stop:4835 length:1335 start_codon:yes stop_codon:yes gene_type:complete
MPLETGNYISALVKTYPLSSDNVSEGENHLQLIKKILKQNFPVGTNEVGPDQAVQVLIAKSSAPTVDTSATGHAARAMGLLWLDTTANLLKIRNQANDAWITLAIDPETSNSVDVNAGTIDGAIIGGTTPAAVTTSDLTATTADINAGTVDAVLGGTTPAAITGTTIKANTSLELATGATVTGIDNATLATGSATLVPTQGAVKTYVDAQVSAHDLDYTDYSDTGGLSVDLDTQTFKITGSTGVTTAGSGQILTVSGTDATTSAKGVASFSSDNFGVSSGAVTIKDAGVANAELANMAANTVKVRNANSSGVPSDLALATTQVMIGDGTGFTAAALSGDATMTNAGAVSVVKIQGQDVSATAATNDQYLKYSSASSEWQKVNVVGDDKLTTKGDLLVYNTVDSETRLPISTNDYVLTADSTATNGLAWKEAVDNAAAMALALGG